MTSIQAKVDAVKSAASSISTCTPATVVALKELLGIESESATSKAKTTARGAKSTSSTASVSKTKAASAKASKESSLGTKERTALATHVINVTIKALSEAAKTAPPSTPSKPREDASRTPAKRTLRRSTSAPLSPLQPRTLNRVVTSPVLTNKSSTTKTGSSTGCLATVECARVAFAALRNAKGPLQADQTDLQLENGMSTLIGKLLSLNMHDQALKEMRILKRRLDGAGASDDASSSLAALLRYQESLPTHRLTIAVNSQLQILKLAAATKRPSHIESLLPELRESNPTSPLNLLSLLAKQSEKDAAKVARHMAALSQVLLSLGPSVASKEDNVATEPRLSPSPLVAFELQSLAFQAQLRWWKLAGHKGNIDEEILSPFGRCVRCLIRRQKAEHVSIYKTVASAFNDLVALANSSPYQPSSGPDSSLASLYQLLGSTAQTARQNEEAYHWYRTLRDLFPKDGSATVRSYSATARVLAVALKQPETDEKVEDLLEEVTNGLDGTLSGTATELNELLESLCSARRSVVSILMNHWDPKIESATTEQVTDLLNGFVLRYPRFARRWLGSVPGKDAPLKQTLQFDQRRQMLMQSINQTLDATLMVVKCSIQSPRVEWQQLDEALQDCAALLDCLTDPALSPIKMDQLGGYHVKISGLYFNKYTLLRKETARSKQTNKQLFQALSRSIDVVKERPLADKEKARLSGKLEIFADLCKGSGHTEDASRTLRSICTTMAEEGVLSTIAVALATQSPSVAWSLNERSSVLSRTLRTVAKVDKTWNDWTLFLPEVERAAVLEHLVHIRSDQSSQTEPLQLHDPCLSALFRIYTLESYPLRRLRMLLKVYQQNLGDNSATDEIASLADEAARQLEEEKYGEDASLQSFAPHLLAYRASMSALAGRNEAKSIASMKQAVASWSAMLASCSTKDALVAIIDDCEGLLSHLTSSYHYAGLKGRSELQLSILKLSNLITKLLATSESDSLVLGQSLLANQYVNMGMFSQALAALEQVKSISITSEAITQQTTAQLYLSHAEYLVGVGNTSDASDYLTKVKGMYGQPPSTGARAKSQTTLVMALAGLLQSTVSIQSGDIPDALSSIKTTVRTLSQDWSRYEASNATNNVHNDSSVAETSSENIEVASSKARVFGPQFWSLAYPLLRSLLHISSVYAHIGMYQETIYYADSAWKIAESTQSSMYKAQVAAWKGSVYLRASKPDLAVPMFTGLKDWIPEEVCSSRVKIARQLGEYYREAEDEEQAATYFKLAEETAHQLSKTSTSSPPKSEESEPVKTTTKPTRASRTTRTTKPKATPASKRTAAAAKAKVTAAPVNVSTLPTEIYQASLLAAISLSRTVGFVQQQDWKSAFSTLEKIKDLPKLLSTLSQEQVLTATSLIGHSMEQMIHDPVFSVMQDSTISFPAVTGGMDRLSTDHSAATISPPPKGRAGSGDRKASKELQTPAFADALRKAQQLLLEVHNSALSKSDSSMVHKISSMLQSTMIILSATMTTKYKTGDPSSFGPVAIDMARNIVWKREQKTLQPQTNLCHRSPHLPADAARRRSSLGFTSEMSSFQKQYVETIPKHWSAISISLGNNQQDLCITKFQAGHSPFILRLPLERANCRDADSEVFNFEHGREELLDIINLANETSHSAKDFSARGERNAWWAERESLDSRLGDLLKTIETTWLGGFKGIFSQHQRRPDLLARFQKSFHQVLDSCLPSRKKVRGKQATKLPAITLDPRILELFIGLGDPTIPDADFDEALNDLLYFVVDILQFHGERNAYDEIDFDAMVVETYDALRGYYAAARSTEPEDGAHTILVLDKALHAFPWESLPCMQGLAVSRVPSLAYLRQALASARLSSGQKSPKENGSAHIPEGHCVSATSGTYILNPSSDLKNTQTFFQSSFTSLKTWTSIVKKIPEEAQFEKALSTSEILLYFGHGSGAQYVRGKTIRRLEKCKPATFLMGCSSASLTEAGEFEAYGPVWNYMMAGCPAVVGTLWDVTDRDIDRFAGQAFEEWGLLPRGTFKEQQQQQHQKSSTKSKGKAKSNCAEEDEKSQDGEAEYARGRSLSEAVAKARTVCRFRYLNAAAVVMYGIPVYLNRNDES